jgi:acyl-CoA synthetase (AMP-forming)/AMP-acid ligase II
VAEGLLRLATGQGRPHCFVDYRIVRRRRGKKRGRDEQGGDGGDDADADLAEEPEEGEYEELPHDGVAFGHLQVRGGTVMRRYHRGIRREEGEKKQDANAAAENDVDGDTVVETVRDTPSLRLASGLPGYPTCIRREWFDTGDVGSIDASRDGALHLTDRAKDVIKSGGEWVSSLALESAASTHPRVASVAAVGVPHARWGERPLLVVVLRPPTAAAAKGGEGGAAAEQGQEEEEESEELKRSILAAVASDARLAKWQVPDDVVFAPALPLNATGKISKIELRRQWKGHYGCAGDGGAE